eukprot:g263.t1
MTRLGPAVKPPPAGTLPRCNLRFHEPQRSPDLWQRASYRLDAKSLGSFRWACGLGEHDNHSGTSFFTEYGISDWLGSFGR